MNNKNFDFYIFDMSEEIENPPSKKSWQDWVDFYYSIWPTTLSGCFLYNYNIIEIYL